MRSTTMNATTIEDTTLYAAQELDKYELEAIRGGIIIIGGFPPIRYMSTLLQADTFQSY